MKGTMTTFISQALPPPPCHLPQEASLFLDLDGTLIEIAARPEGVKVDDDLIRLLAGLHKALAGRVVVVSGRPAAEVRGLLRHLPIAIAGSHGAELQFADGGETSHTPAEPPAHVMAQLRQLAVQAPGVLIEAKPHGIAVHYRLAPHARAACHALAERIAAEEGYVLQPGKQVIELKFHATNKGDAVRAFMHAAPAGRSKPFFIGDDLTDEEGFKAARALGGAGILVGDRHPTEASYRLPDVGSALRWLGQAVAGQR